MRKFVLTLALALYPSITLAQSTPGLVYGQIPAPQDWNSYFASKQDVLSGEQAPFGQFVTGFDTTGHPIYAGINTTFSKGLTVTNGLVADTGIFNNSLIINGPVSLRGGANFDSLNLTNNLKLAIKTIANLPVCNGSSVGFIFYIVDSASSNNPVYHGTVSGNGTIVVSGPVSCNGSTWQWE